jgi:hypothetical protein
VTRVIINGDDFGYSDAINAGIIRCHVEGILTSATILVNQPATRAAFRLARATPTLGVGWHVNLTEGVPVQPPRTVPTLVGRDGRFRPLVAQLAGLLRGTTRADEIERELRAQLAILLDAGIKPTHLDGHLHAHAFPRVLPIVLKLMATFEIPALRSPALGAWLPRRDATGIENPWGALRPGSPLAPILRSGKLLGALGRLAPLLDRARLRTIRRTGLICADRLCDNARFLAAPDPPAALVATLAGGDRHLTEIMAHPAWNRDARRGAAEVALLTTPGLRAALDANGIRRVYYGQW